MNRDFRIFWTGQLTSRFGSALTAVAIPLVAVAHLGASIFQVGVLVAAASAPKLLFGVVIATWGDGLPRKRPFLIRADLLAATGTLGLAALLFSGRLTVPAMIAGVFLLSLLRTFAETIYFVHLRGLVGEDQLVLARARLQAAEQIGFVTGRAVVGPLVIAVTAAMPFVVDAITYLVNAACLRSLRTAETPIEPGRPGDRTPFGRRMWGGAVEIRRQPFLRRLLPYILLAQLALGAATALIAPFLLLEIGVPVAAYGLLFVMVGVAGTLGALVSSALTKRGVDPRSMVLWGYGLAAVPILVLAVAGGPLPLAATMAAAGIGLPGLFSAIANVGLTGFITRVVPLEVLGRTAMTLQIANTLPIIVGAPLGGLLADRVGIRPALACTAVLAVLAAGLLLPLARLMSGQPAPGPVRETFVTAQAPTSPKEDQ
jgi:predicted MFS family arabinose efflux permease